MLDVTVSIGRAAALLGVAVVTLCRWCKDNKIQVKYRTAGGHRRFCLSELRRLRGEEAERKMIGYARVSSHDQKKDLVTQAYRLSNLGCDEVISDLGSGLNCKKPGLRKLLKFIISGDAAELVLLHKDRLLRFGHELVFQLCRWFGVKVTIVNEEKSISFDEELTKDVIALMTVFSARLYGKQSHANRRLA